MSDLLVKSGESTMENKEDLENLRKYREDDEDFDSEKYCFGCWDKEGILEKFDPLHRWCRFCIDWRNWCENCAGCIDCGYYVE